MNWVRIQILVAGVVGQTGTPTRQAAVTVDITNACMQIHAVMPADQITVRGVEPDLSERLRAISRERGESLNSTVLRLLRDAVGVDARRQRLDRYAGWTADEAAAFNAALRTQRRVADTC